MMSGEYTTGEYLTGQHSGGTGGLFGTIGKSLTEAVDTTSNAVNSAYRDIKGS
jgi:hypothetical protein